jgi:hypothetical protein
MGRVGPPGLHPAAPRRATSLLDGLQCIAEDTSALLTVDAERTDEETHHEDDHGVDERHATSFRALVVVIERFPGPGQVCRTPGRGTGRTAFAAVDPSGVRVGAPDGVRQSLDRQPGLEVRFVGLPGLGRAWKRVVLVSDGVFPGEDVPRRPPVVEIG